MGRPIILITTGRNIYSLRAYDAIRLTCEKLNIQYDVGYVETERLTAAPVQAVLRSTLCRTHYKIKSDLIYRYRRLSKHAANRDIRPEIDRLFKHITPQLCKDNSRFVAALKVAPWIFSGHGIFTKPFLDQTDPRLIQYNQLSLLQWPPAHLGSPSRKANFMMVVRGGILGESRMATDPTYLPGVLKRHRGNQCLSLGYEFNAQKIIEYLTENKYTEHESVEPVPSVNKEKAIFVPLHCAWDAQMIRFSPFFGRNQEFLQFVIDNTPDDTVLVVKAHPKATAGLLGKVDPVVAKFKDHPKVRFTEANIHDIFAAVSVVVTLNSSVGVEAIPAGLPVVVLGKAFYSHIPNVTFTAADLGKARDLLSYCLALSVDKQMARVAIDYFWNKYLVPIQPPGAFEGRVRTLVNACMKVEETCDGKTEAMDG